MGAAGWTGLAAVGYQVVLGLAGGAGGGVGADAAADGTGQTDSALKGGGCVAEEAGEGLIAFVAVGGTGEAES